MSKNSRLGRVIILGDLILNARVGRQDDAILGELQDQQTDDNGEHLVEFCSERSLWIPRLSPIPTLDSSTHGCSRTSARVSRMTFQTLIGVRYPELLAKSLYKRLLDNCVDWSVDPHLHLANFGRQASGRIEKGLSTSTSSSTCRAVYQQNVGLIEKPKTAEDGGCGLVVTGKWSSSMERWYDVC